MLLGLNILVSNSQKIPIDFFFSPNAKMITTNQSHYNMYLIIILNSLYLYMFIFCPINIEKVFIMYTTCINRTVQDGTVNHMCPFFSK